MIPSRSLVRIAASQRSINSRICASSLLLLFSVEAGYGPERRTQVAEQLTAYAKEASLSDQAQRLRDHYLSRLFAASIYMRELKGRFAQWYNRRHHRYGVLWAERFKSVLIEEGQALSAVAAYIDLNPLRAGLCEDPRGYRYCCKNFGSTH
jgi:putative transposase